VQREAPKCANDECTKQGLHRCDGCKGVMYCLAACRGGEVAGSAARLEVDQ
jgi:hypothetical protein